MRIVLDANVLVSGLISAGGPPGQLIDHWLDGRFELITSDAQLAELARVLRYERIASRLPAERTDVLLRNLRIATLIQPATGVEESPDPDDNLIIATAIAANATLIISGDKSDVLALNEARGIRIVNARAGLRLIPPDQREP